MDALIVTMLALLALGALFFLAELLVGSDGPLSGLAVLCWLGASWFLWRGWMGAQGVHWWMYVLAVVVGIPGLVGAIVTVLPHSALGRELLGGPDPEDVYPFPEEDDLKRESFIGRIGKTLTLMNPGGLVLIDGERLHAETEGLVVDPAQPVEVIDVRANRLVVRPWMGLPTGDHFSEPEDLAY